MLKIKKPIIIKSDNVVSSGLKIHYELTLKESARFSSFKLPLYSISIEMEDQEGKQSSYKATDVFSDINKALEFYIKIVEGIVTPSEMPYIIEDMFCIE